jgi:hypothetical protein
MIPNQTKQETFAQDLYALHCEMYSELNNSQKLEELDSRIQQFIQTICSMFPEPGKQLLKEYHTLNITKLILDKNSNFFPNLAASNRSSIIQKIRQFENILLCGVSSVLPEAKRYFERQVLFAKCFKNIISGTATLPDLQKIFDKGEVNIDACRACTPSKSFAAPENTFNSQSLIEYYFHNTSHNIHPDLLKFLLKNGATINQEQSCSMVNAFINGRVSELKDNMILELLISNGFNIDAKSAGGESLLQEAIRGQDKDVIHLLILHGSQVNDDIISMARDNGCETEVQATLEQRQNKIHESVKEEMAEVPALARLSRDVLGLAASFIDELSQKDLLKKP